MMEPEGSTYWAVWKRFINNELLRNGFIEKEDMNLFRIAKSTNEAIRYIEDFYRVYHSIRYVSGRTVLRLNREISQKTLAVINKKFKGILSGGEIKLSPPLKEEVEKWEYPGLPRLVMDFNFRNYGKLTEMIHIINRD
jgi:hypothetical protein